MARAIVQAPICYLPLGVLEWHGEQSSVGLDGIKAQPVCEASARRSGGGRADALVGRRRAGRPPGRKLPAERDRGRGSRPRVGLDVLGPTRAASRVPARRLRGDAAALLPGAIVVVAGHWSPRVYPPTVRASGQTFAARHPDVGWLLLTDHEVVPNLFYLIEHAAGGETSLLMAGRADLVDLARTFETDRSLAQWYAGEPGHLERRRETPHRYIGLFTGPDDGSNNPETSASSERGRALLDAIGERIAARATALLVGARPGDARWRGAGNDAGCPAWHPRARSVCRPAPAAR